MPYDNDRRTKHRIIPWPFTVQSSYRIVTSIWAAIQRKQSHENITVQKNRFFPLPTVYNFQICSPYLYVCIYPTYILYINIRVAKRCEPFQIHRHRRYTYQPHHLVYLLLHSVLVFRSPTFLMVVVFSFFGCCCCKWMSIEVFSIYFQYIVILFSYFSQKYIHAGSAASAAERESYHQNTMPHGIVVRVIKVEGGNQCINKTDVAQCTALNWL